MKTYSWLGLVCFALLSPKIFAATDYAGFGYVRVRGVAPPVSVARPLANAETALKEIRKAGEEQVAVLSFPELFLTGYSAEDYLFKSQLLNQNKIALKKIMDYTGANAGSPTVIIGAPLATPDGRFYNAAYVISRGQIKGVIPKEHLPNYAEFYDRRWFESGAGVNQTFDDPLLGEIHVNQNQIFAIGEMQFAVEICEDAWAVIPPSSFHALNGANVIFNLSASNELAGKADFRRQLITGLSSSQISAYVYVSAGPTESSRDLVFGGHSLIAENGDLLEESPRFDFRGSVVTTDIDVDKLLADRRRNKTFGAQRSMVAAEYVALAPTLSPLTKGGLLRSYPRNPFFDIPKEKAAGRAEEIFQIQVTGLMRRLAATGAKKIVIGVSGGSDSTLALLVAWQAVKRMRRPTRDILAITMPGFGTTDRTKSQADDLMRELGTETREISIAEPVLAHFKAIGQSPDVYDITYENAQARERTQILFDTANKENGIVLGTGDLSELCVGWCTYNGDHMSHYAVNSTIPKTLVKFLIAEWNKKQENLGLRRILDDILGTEISPELLPAGAGGEIAQKSEDTVGSYLLNDFMAYHYLRNQFSPEKIQMLAGITFPNDYTAEDVAKHWQNFGRRFENQRFKSTAQPSGGKAGSVSLSPRDARYPDDLGDCAELLNSTL